MATELSCGMKCLKYMLFAINFIVWVCGIAVFGFGIYSRVKSGNWDDLIADASLSNAANLLIAAGAIVMVIGFVGCCGAVKQNRPFLIIYIILLLLIFILEIAGGIYAYTKKDEVISSFQKGLKATIDKSYGQEGSANEGLTKSVDWIQENIKCCGTNGAKSWNATLWHKAQTGKVLVPKSCCKDQNAAGCNEADDYNALKNIYSDDCIVAGEKFIKDHMVEVGGVGVGLAFIQLIGIIFAILLVKAINENKL